MRTRLASIAFVFLWLLSTACLWQPFRETLRLALGGTEFTHILLILPISAALTFSQWNSAKLTPSWSPWMGLFLGATGALIALSARWWLGRTTPDVRLSVEMVALVVLWIAAFALSFGTRAAEGGRGHALSPWLSLLDGPASFFSLDENHRSSAARISVCSRAFVFRL
jgi:hypothetical protein